MARIADTRLFNDLGNLPLERRFGEVEQAYVITVRARRPNAFPEPLDPRKRVLARKVHHEGGIRTIRRRRFDARGSIALRTRVFAHGKFGARPTA